MSAGAEEKISGPALVICGFGFLILRHKRPKKGEILPWRTSEARSIYVLKRLKSLVSSGFQVKKNTTVILSKLRWYYGLSVIMEFQTTKLGHTKSKPSAADSIWKGGAAAFARSDL